MSGHRATIPTIFAISSGAPHIGHIGSTKPWQVITQAAMTGNHGPTRCSLIIHVAIPLQEDVPSSPTRLTLHEDFVMVYDHIFIDTRSYNILDMTISRRQFLGTALTASASGLLLNTAEPTMSAETSDRVSITNDHLLIEVNCATGCLNRFESKHHGWTLKGAGMRLHVPAPNHRYHFLNEKSTGRPVIESNGNDLAITWHGFQSERLGLLDIEIKQSIRLEKAGVHFNYNIRNGSGHEIESYTFPRLAGLFPPGGDKSLQQAAWGYSGMHSSSMWPTFSNEVGYWGSDTPAQLRTLGTDTQFCLVLSDSRGIYLGYHDQRQTLPVQISFTLTPGFAESYNSTALDPTHKLPDPRVGLDPNFLCFVAPGGSQRSEDLVFEPFAGDWHAGADIYKAWRRTWFKTPRTAKWVHDVHSWQQIQINSSEDRLLFPYKDLPRYAEACKRWGVKALQVTGWQNGGQDRDFPQHDTDPRLGTAQEFKDAISECRRMGVEVILFNKYAWADETAPDFANTFRKYAIEDPFGLTYCFSGYDYDTPTQLAGINARPGVGMCTASPAWRKRALQEFKKSVDLGASGILYDECQWHLSAYCFSKNHGHSVPGAVYSGDVPLIDEFRTIVNPEEFLFAGESPYDLELQTYNMSYYRIANWFGTPFARYIDPYVPMSVAVTGFNDRHLINACLLYRLSMSYEPRNFHGELDEMPDTMAYGRAMDEFRRKYRDWVWESEFRDTLGARVLVDGKLHKSYSVFQRTNGLRAVAFANMSDSETIVCEVALENAPQASLKFVSPEHPDSNPWPGKLELAPGFAAVVLE